MITFLIYPKLAYIIKLISDDGRTTPIPRPGKPELPEPQEHMCLVRAKFRSKKIATVIHQKDVNKFQVAFSNLLKGKFYSPFFHLNIINIFL